MESKVKLILIGAILVVLFAGGSLLYSLATANPMPVAADKASAAAENSPPGENDQASIASSVAAPEDNTQSVVDATPTASPNKAIKYVDFSLETLDGRKVALSDYEGVSAIVLNFWASWCGPCQQEMPHFQKLEEEYRDKGVVFLMVNSTDGKQETKEKAEAYLEEAGLKFDNVLLDTELEASYIYSVTSIPATYVFDKDGIYVKGFRGSITEEQLGPILAEISQG